MKKIKENSFEAGVGGVNGIVNVQPGYGTFASPNVNQNPDQFSNSNNNKAVNQTSNTAKAGPKKAGDTKKDINAIYAKRDTPSADEVVSGIKYELGQQNKKDKGLAKQIVLANLKKDPHHYSSLKMLNIDDKSMMDNMTESKQHPNDAPAKIKVTSNIEETKKIFTELAKGKDQKYVVNSQICDVMKEMWDAKRARSSWKTEK